MRQLRFLGKWTRYFSFAAIALATLPGISARAAQPYRSRNYCPPQNCPQYCPQYEGETWQQPNMAAPADGSDVAPPSEDGQVQDQGQQQAQPQQQPQMNNDLNLAPQNSNFQVATSGEGSNVGHIGRADGFNRLNIFDSQSAIPTNRVYVGMQYLDRFHVSNDPLDTDRTASQVAYRVGGEVKVTDSSSITFQSQYTDVRGTSNIQGSTLRDSWANPQVMAKQVVYEDTDLVVSGTFGALIPIGGVDDGEFRETTTRIAPGMLFYANTYDKVFNYGGFQFSIPLGSGEQVDTFDWCCGTGYWLYENCCCCDTLVERVCVQYEVFGKHTMGTNVQTYRAGGIIGGVPLGISENRDIFDMTCGVSIFLCNGVRASFGYSLPISRGFARRHELIGTVGYYF